VIPLRIPPLRDRKEDIPLLAARFLKEFALKEGEPEKKISDDALDLLMEHDWPGNVRELKNLIERLVIMAPVSVITKNEIPFLGKEGMDLEFREDFADIDFGSASYREAKMEFEKQYIARKLREFEGNISRTAEAIGLERSNLHRKIKNYGLETK